ncbi:MULTISPECIES: DHA2 family efflux MFS transporter permease subunit [unclassified Ruegeria]|uniref:DHA2 family efflux MFS transporter permease subunit n=1 Tax=unclassified Ruegeria TaxID=2625375 RepID=UPI0014877E7D|nr:MULTISPECIES: DHA2 family efflux MFS transporter permease subunit [unclassified Ruegeria]NOD77923.1 DHA2 family efflux MFS transporter permease subunit [Ruegeria sp. HKCCD4332]NOD88154.1 DHA2 family efflux MFS transporter permease subunit [Ruegeria sp. HKCCD4318]NOE15002.1 DHA2 family efflux MFS transporter permease subunit [Ruegeria sp. HKCCD4318-2]NOG11395.1 DHA2 family efflux MFS transporter permease subunit [Ruegeria sp. HKCCD4315]
MTSATSGHVNRVIVVAVVLSAILEVLDSTIVNVALPHIQAAFGATTDQATWILTSYIVSAVVIMPLTGFVARRVGRRRLILTAVSGFALMSVMCGLSWSLEVIVAFRLAQGMFGAFLIPLSQSILFDAFPREDRGKAMAIFGLGVVVAPVLGPTVGAILTEYFSWRMVFFVNLPVAALALLLLAGELPEDKTEDVKIDWKGLALLALGIGCLQFVLDQGETMDWMSSRIIQVAVVASILGAIGFVVHALVSRDAVVDLRLFADRNFALCNLIIAGFAVSLFGGIAILPTLVQNLLDFPVIASGHLFIPRGITAGLSMVLTGAVLVHHFDPRVLTGAGLLLTAIGNFMMGALNLNAGFWELAWPGAISGLGMGLVFVPMSILAFESISKNRQDEASGLFNVTRQLGSSVGISLVGTWIVRGLQTNTAVLSQNVTPYNPAAQAYLSPLGLTPDSAEGAVILGQEIARQAEMISYLTVFNNLGLLALATIPLLFFCRAPKPGTQSTAHVH